MFPTRFFCRSYFAPRYFPRPAIAQVGGMMYARRLPDAYDNEDDALILLLMGALLDE